MTYDPKRLNLQSIEVKLGKDKEKSNSKERQRSVESKEKSLSPRKITNSFSPPQTKEGKSRY
jgi:hypothetical protein